MLNLLLCAGTFVAAEPAPGPSAALTSTALTEYRALAAKTSANAPDQVRLALWCEEHGLTAERLKHLARAVVKDPKQVLARGLMGMIEHRGKWLAPEAVASALQNDGTDAAARAEYNTRRDKLAERTDAEKARVDQYLQARNLQLAHSYRARAVRALAVERLKLGIWCEGANLIPEATAEFTTAVHLDPRVDDAWKHLGYVRRDGRWVPADQAIAEDADAKAQGEANRRWEPMLKKWRSWLKDETRQAEAEKQLGVVSDRRAVPAVSRVFFTARADDQTWAARILAAIDAPPSTRLLAKLAVFSAFEDVRRSAIDHLKNRAARDYADILVNLVHQPATYAVQPVSGPGSRGVLVIDTPRFQLTRSYDAPPPFQFGANFYGYVGYDNNGLPVAARGREITSMERQLARGNAQGAWQELANIEERTAVLVGAANLKAVAAQQQMMADIGDVERFNAQSSQVNKWVGAVLQETLDAPDLKNDEDGWHRWWYDQVGYSYTPPQKMVLNQVLPSSEPPRLASCFVAGTPVKTIDGPRPIESLRPGDRILSQDTETGALAFQPVLAVHHNPPAATVKLTLDGGEVVVPSTYHRFWIAGKGWQMARALKAGDVLRTLGGRIKVVGAERGDVEPVFNLDVARDHTFFVGARDSLVHDNTLPATRGKVFDALANVERVAPPRAR